MNWNDYMELARQGRNQERTEQAWNRLISDIREHERRQDLINQERTVQEAKRIIAGEG